MAVLSLPEAKAHLNITGLVHDADLAAVIEAVEAAIAERVGPLEPTTVTSRVGGGAFLVLPVSPVVSLTSVLANGTTAVDVAGLYLDCGAGVVEYLSGAGFGARTYVVTYSAGRSTCPPDLLLAVKELVRHVWDTQRGPSRRPGSTSGEAMANTMPSAAYTFPFRVEQLLVPHAQKALA